MNKNQILIVDDEAPARSRLRDLLGDLAETQPTRIAGMAGNAGYQVVLFGEFQNVIDNGRFLIHWDDDVFFADNQTFSTYCFGKGFTRLPDFG